ncbi:MAG: hypothetical protein M3275_00100 [Thermoproteota archaeon]|nr:hypothetical protein [Thermoproteota archaeon]
MSTTTTTTATIISEDRRNKIPEGIDFILSHFPSNEEEKQFPRTASTLVTEGGQKDVYNKEHLLALYEEAHGFDLRLSGYLNYAYFIKKGELPWGYCPSKVLLLIDQERGDIKTTLHNIKLLCNGGHPSVLWTGHGHHIYLPLLLTNKEFANNEQLTFDYLRFIERRVSNYQSDKAHKPALRSSMCRIPFSWNSKCVKEGSELFEVQILQKWDGHRPTPSRQLFEEFMTMRTRSQIKELKQEIVQTKIVKKIKAEEYTKQGGKKEKAVAKDPLKDFLIFHSKGISDGRRNTLYYIISRYLIREQFMTPEQIEAICHDWLRRCNLVSRLRYTPQYLKYHVKHCIEDAVHRNRNSMPVETILKGYASSSVEVYNQLIAEYEEFKSRQQKTSPQLRGGEQRGN